MILISRTDPPSAFSRFLANGDMACLGWDKLRLAFDECREVIRYRTGQNLPDQLVRELHTYTEGWAAGLVLLLDGRGRELNENYRWGTLPCEDIFNYFTGEVIDKMDSRTRIFLYQSSLLPRMTVDLARKLTGVIEASAILRRLHEENSFINRRFSHEVLYQYHPLFRSFLLSRLTLETPEEELSKLRQKAAALLEEDGSFEDALSLLQEDGDWEAIARVLFSKAPDLIARNQFQTLEYWLTSLPRQQWDYSNWFLYWLGMCRVSHHPSKAQQHFIEAYKKFKECEDLTGVLLAWSGIVDTYLYVFATFRSLDIWLEEIEGILANAPVLPSPEMEAKVTASLITALALRNPAHPRFEILMQRSRFLAEQCADPGVKVQAYLPLAFCRLFKGHFQEVGALLDTFGKYAFQTQCSPLFRVMQKDLEAFYYWKSCRFQECWLSAEQGLSLAEEAGIPAFRFFLLGHSIAALLSKGDTNAAHDILSKVSKDLDSARSWEKSYYHVMSTWAFLLCGDLVNAGYQAEQGMNHAQEAGEFESLAICHLGQALVYYSLKERKKAINLLKTARELGVVEPNAFAVFNYDLVEAEFALGNRENRHAEKKLRQALRMGRRQGYFNTYFWRPQVMSNLCALALEREIEPEYVQKIIQRRDLPVPESKLYLHNWPFPVKIRTFGCFELTINGELLEACEKTPARPLELLKIVLALGGRYVNKNQVCDILWPDSSGDAAQSALSTNLQGLRRLLGKDKFIIVSEGMIFLNERFCWVDFWQLEALLNELSQMWKSRETQWNESNFQNLIIMATSIYRGPFMAEATYDSGWILPLRQKFQRELAEWHLKLGKHFEEKTKLDQAVQHYRDARNIDPFREECYQRLMRCYMDLGLKAEAMSEYRLCRLVMRENFDCEPSEKTKELCRSF